MIRQIIRVQLVHEFLENKRMFEKEQDDGRHGRPGSVRSSEDIDVCLRLGQSINMSISRL